jgi:glutathionyl-hydroquinone reductase
MGQLENGVWVDAPLARTRDGAFDRPASVFRHWVTPTAAPAPRARAASRPPRAAITSMSATPAPGRTAR